MNLHSAMTQRSDTVATDNNSGSDDWLADMDPHAVCSPGSQSFSNMPTVLDLVVDMVNKVGQDDDKVRKYERFYCDSISHKIVFEQLKRNALHNCTVCIYAIH